MYRFGKKYIYEIGLSFFSVLTFFISLYYMFPEVWSSDSLFEWETWQGFATGADGYYYAYQVREFIARGYFPSPEVSPVLYFMAIVATVLGNVIASNKVAAVLIKVAFVFPAYHIGRSLFSPKAGSVFAVLLVSSSFMNYYTYQYIKNSGALFFFLCFLVYLVKFSKNREFHNTSYKYNVGLVLFFVLAFLSHKTTAFLSFLTVVIYIIYQYKSKIYMIVAVGLVLLATFFLAGHFLPNIVYIGDLLRFEGYFSGNLSCAACEYITRAGLALQLETLLFLFSLPVFLLFLLNKSFRSKIFQTKEAKIVASIMALIFLFAVNPFGGSINNDMTFRLFILVFIPGAFFISTILGFSIDFFQSKIQRREDLFSKKWRRAIGVALLTLFSFFALPNQVISAKRFEKSSLHDYKLYSQLMPFIKDLPQNSLLVIHQGFDYFYWYHTGKKAFHFMPEKKHEDRALYRMAWGVPRNGFILVLKESGHMDQLATVKYLPGNYILLEEETWRLYLQFITPEEKAKLNNWRNPHTYRKEYLLRNQQFRKK